MTRCMLYRRGHIGDKGRGRQGPGACLRTRVRHTVIVWRGAFSASWDSFTAVIRQALVSLLSFLACRTLTPLAQ